MSLHLRKLLKLTVYSKKILTFNVKVENPNGDEAISGLLSHTCIVSCSRGHLSLYCRLHREKLKKKND